MTAALGALVTAAVLALTVSAPPAHAQTQRHGRLFPPENLGELEGPDRDAYQMPDAVMDALGIGEGTAVADIGAGGGWFTVRLSRRVGPNGVVYAQDVQQPMLEAIKRRADREGLTNVVLVRGDQTDPHLPAASVDVVLIVDVYHEFGDNAIALLGHLARALKPGGRIGVINYTKDGGGPGPPADERVDESRVVRDAEAAGLRLLRKETFLPFEYFVILVPASGPPAETRQAPQPGQQGRSDAQLQHVGDRKRIEANPQRRAQP